MSSPSAVVCREIFDENSQPSADEISEYAQQLGIDPESESHLLPLAREGLMQALPPPWKAYFDEKLQTHYYYNEETKKTQWEHPLDNVYRELVKRARDASTHDDTCASVQELPTSEDHTKNLERVETKVESDDDELSTDSENHPSDVKDATNATQRRLTPLGRPPLAPLSRLDKKLSDLRISPLRRSVDSPISPKPVLVRNTSDRDLLCRPTFERPKVLFKQQSEIIDLKMHVLNSPEDENFSPLLSSAKIDKGLPFSGKGNMFLKFSKSDLPSPDTEKSLPADSVTKSDPPKGILREKSDSFQRKNESAILGRPKQTASFDEDKKSVRFKLENVPEPTVSPGSNSSSDQNEGQSSIISAPPSLPSSLAPLSPIVPSSPVIPLSPISSPVPSMMNTVHLSPLVARPPLPPRPQTSESARDNKNVPSSEKDSLDGETREKSPRRRLLRPPASDYIKPDLFQKNFQKISDLVRRGEVDSTPVSLEESGSDKESRPRSPMVPQKNKISINLMESIESETSIDSPDREFANIDLNDLDESNESHNIQNEAQIENNIEAKNNDKEVVSAKEKEETSETHSKASEPIQNMPQCLANIPIPQIKVPKLDFLSKQQKFAHSDSEESRKSSNREEDIKITPRSNSIDIPKDDKNQIKLSPTPSLGSDRSPRLDFGKTWSSPFSTFKPLNKAVISPQIKSSDSSTSLGKGVTSPRLDGVIISQSKSSSDNVVVVYQFETQEDNLSKPIKSPLIPDMGTRDFMERNKNDERRRLELSLQKELELIRMEWSAKEKKMKAELQEELREAEQKFLTEKRVRLDEQAERHKKEMEDALSAAEHNHEQMLQNALKEIEKRYQIDVEAAEKQHADSMARLREDYRVKLTEEREQLEIENERALTELREQLQISLNTERTQMIEENRATIEALREEHTNRVTDLRHDYRAEVEHLRRQHACHVEELRARLAGERAAAARGSTHERALADKYRCLKEKYARLKHDVKVTRSHTLTARCTHERALADMYRCLKEKYARLKHDVKVTRSHTLTARCTHERALADMYRCLKEKYARLKHDVKVTRSHTLTARCTHERALADMYRCLKEKYARLKHDVKVTRSHTLTARCTHERALADMYRCLKEKYARLKHDVKVTRSHTLTARCTHERALADMYRCLKEKYARLKHDVKVTRSHTLTARCTHERALADMYRCLKEKYARLKHDVKVTRSHTLTARCTHERALADMYRCLKEKYARLKHDVKVTRSHTLTARCTHERALADMYRCLKEKYARLKHDVKVTRSHTLTARCTHERALADMYRCLKEKYARLKHDVKVTRSHTLTARCTHERALADMYRCLKEKYARLKHDVKVTRSHTLTARCTHERALADMYRCLKEKYARLKHDVKVTRSHTLTARCTHERALADMYRCLKEKYARLKHDVKMSIERRNKRREMSMTTGSETEKSNSHKATQSLEKCKEVNETSVSAVIETEPLRVKANNNPTIKYNDNETSISESNAHKSENNNDEWKAKSSVSISLCIVFVNMFLFRCLNITTAKFMGNFQQLKRTWKCPTCTNVTKRRHRNDDTPLKINSEESSPPDLVDTSGGDSISQTEDSNEQLSPNMELPGVPKVNTFSFSLEEIGKLLDHKLDSKLKSAHVCLATEIKQEFRDVLKNLESDFKQITESITQEVCSLKQEVSTLSEKVQALENENICIRKEIESSRQTAQSNTHLESIVAELQQQITYKDQEALLNDVEIVGIPEFSGETPMHIVLTVASKLGVSLTEQDIVYAERVGRRLNWPAKDMRTGNQNSSSVSVSARPLVVRLTRRALRDHLIKNARVRRTLTTVDLGLLPHESSTFYVNERLTKTNRILFAKTREMARNLNWKFVWTKGGRVYVKREDSPNIYARIVNSEMDIERVFGVPCSKTSK
ncbi:unnamed protein product [Parnassius mnemosyne]|uniref:WW domain-containing protein n=1 Tax=Parnassius mnemosyne TaxID=213953 RepID=A0AAV1KL06_9NEOP